MTESKGDITMPVNRGYRDCITLGSGATAETVCIGYLPGRKKAALYFTVENGVAQTIYPIAWFKNADDASMFRDFMFKLTRTITRDTRGHGQ